MIHQERKTYSLVIVNGPSLKDLFAALMTGCEKHPFMPYFEIAEGQKLPEMQLSTKGRSYLARILGLEYEDGSGESFNIIGIAYDDQDGRLRTPITHRFVMNYHVRKRTGYIKFTVNLGGNSR